MTKNYKDDFKETIKKMLLVVIIGALVMAADFIAAARQGGDIVKKGGKVFIIRPVKKSPSHFKFNVTIEDNKTKLDKKVSVKIDPQGFEKPLSESGIAETGEGKKDIEQLEYELRRIVYGLNDDTDKPKVELPGKLKTGENIRWEREKETNTFFIFTAVIVIIILIMKTRTLPFERLKKQKNDSIIKGLPEFINKIVLLMNAGLVLNNAFEKAIIESLQFNNDEGDYFMGKMKEIHLSIRGANASPGKEFRKFARESGTKELIRISNIINDNIDKGVELTGKLHRESEILWLSRKKNSEEKGKIAETKLVLPLMLFLIVLIMITIGPALIEI